MTDNQTNISDDSLKDFDPSSIEIHEVGDEKYKILIIDDEKIMRELLKGIIEETTPYTVDVATSAEEGFKKYKKDMHQIIILDIRLSGNMNGVDLLKKIKKHDRVVNIIMITGYGTIDMAVECMKAGAWDFITKPFSYDHFVVIIKRAAENLKLQKLAKERNFFLELSKLDGLTEIYNRRIFEFFIDAEIKRGNRYRNNFSLIFIDLDNFKQINDNFGHQKGDEVLKNMALLMKKISRDSDFVFRYGGDEFSMILPETKKDGAMIYANRLKEKTENIIIEGKAVDGTHKKYSLSVSIGIVQFPQSASNKEELIKFADFALLEAKKNKNKIVYYTAS